MHVIEVALVFLEGVALIASPCILPVMPLVLSGSIEGGKLRPYGIIVGFILAFSTFALLAHKLILLLHINLALVKNVSLILLAAFSILLIFPTLWEKAGVFIKVPTQLNSPISQKGKEGFWSGMIIGSLIGFIWTPCAGPIMAAALVQIIRQQTNLTSFIMLIAFSTGAGIPMLIIALTGRSFINKLGFITKHAKAMRSALGILILLTVAYIAFGMKLDVPVINNDKDKPLVSYKLIEPLSLYYPAPEFSGVEWINSSALTMKKLKGKVVLIDFWTYSCINCVRTLPYLKSWDQKYRDQGLVIVGVHAPEFEFEKNIENVKSAVEKFKIKYPVAMDNNLSTWDNYHNLYWPAHYLIDREGNVVYTHFGEGDYNITEQNIRILLNKSFKDELTPETVTWSTPITPETYLGSLRRSSLYQMKSESPTEIPLHYWSLKGNWETQNEKIISQSSGASISLHFSAQKVFLVMGSANGTPIPVTISLNGKIIQEITVKEHTLYNIIELPKIEDAVLELQSKEPGLEAYAFTFGG